ncbi:hypothetical protein AMATHDRAFT_84462 [Amanita thiersii Skay4041]|uniref:Uncharacterized protein n=1 Tax=Amanita thiersii Skay4041 TaxID=703135 RepID=A0A2A9NRD6_9AGAR|nr:hypothetical protein AMATHDRAFT_84462 [Amanita thiersii Skay4041]
MSSTPHNSRASLLAGLRTGGVRSTSLNVPYTAAPGASFNTSRFPSQHHQPSIYSEDDDQLSEMPSQSAYLNSNHPHRSIPMTASVDGSHNRFAQQQGQMSLNPNSVPFSPGQFNHNIMTQSQLRDQALLLQFEMLRIQTQALQVQQYQIAHAQAQHQQQAQPQTFAQSRDRRTSLHNTPATAGPHVTAFDLRSATLSAQMRRANQAEQLRAQLGLNPAVAEDGVPMTASLGGRFGSRVASATSNLPRFLAEEPEEHTSHMAATSGSTAAIGGGTALSNQNLNIASSTTTPSRSDLVTNWRRGGNGQSALHGNNRTVSSPAVKITPPPGERLHGSPPPPGIMITSPTAKSRPQPLHIFPASQPLTTVAIDNSADTADDDAEVTSSSGGSASARSVLSNGSSPTTPRSSASSTNNETQLSPREEATKKLYEGLGIGRLVPSTSNTSEPIQYRYTYTQQYHQQPQTSAATIHRMVSQPTRQPRGPPSGADELGPKNFATRIRRQAIGGLGVLMGARERRESYVEAY